MIDLFTILTLTTTFLTTIVLSGINFIKHKSLETLKLGTIYTLCFFLLNIFFPSPFHLLIILLLLPFLNKQANKQSIAYFLSLTSIAFINSSFETYSYILLSNLTITILFFLTFSKIIFKNQTKHIEFRLDQLKWGSIQDSQELQDNLRALTPGYLKSFHISKIDTIDESIYVTVKYEE